jgi:hypothetical protein
MGLAEFKVMKKWLLELHSLKYRNDFIACLSGQLLLDQGLFAHGNKRNLPPMTGSFHLDWSR